MFQFAILLLQVANQVFSMLERQRVLAEGERQLIAKQLDAITQTAKVARQIRQHVESKSDEEIDAALRGDFRD